MHFDGNTGDQSEQSGSFAHNVTPITSHVAKVLTFGAVALVRELYDVVRIISILAPTPASCFALPASGPEGFNLRCGCKGEGIVRCRADHTLA